VRKPSEAIFSPQFLQNSGNGTRFEFKVQERVCVADALEEKNGVSILGSKVLFRFFLHIPRRAATLSSKHGKLHIPDKGSPRSNLRHYPSVLMISGA
jgi:hypothetical protein